MSEIITGEAVPLELRLAKLPSRMLAFVIDGAIQIVLLLIALWLGGSVLWLQDASLARFYFVVVIVSIFVGLPTVMETITRGRSVGKLALGLRVVRDDGGPIQFRHALVRALAAALVDVWVLGSLGIGIFTSILSERGKRVGDYLAGTVVLRERVAGTPTPVPAMPPQLASWATGLSLSRLPDGLALAARQYLARYYTLDPVAAGNLGQQLSAEVAAAIGIQQPERVPPWVFLSAVLAERRRREIARLTPTRRPVVPPARPVLAPQPAGVSPPVPATSPPTGASPPVPATPPPTGASPAVVASAGTGSPGGPFAPPA